MSVFLNVAWLVPSYGEAGFQGPHQLFETAEQALQDAAAYVYAQPEHTQIEFGGWIIRDPTTGLYTYSEPSRGNAFSVEIPNSLTLKYSWGQQPVMWFHSHPRSGPDGEIFSVQDQSAALAQPKYKAALFTPSGRILIFP